MPGKSHGQRSLAGYHPWGCKESDTTERFHFHNPNHAFPPHQRAQPPPGRLQGGSQTSSLTTAGPRLAAPARHCPTPAPATAWKSAVCRWDHPSVRVSDGVVKRESVPGRGRGQVRPPSSQAAVLTAPGLCLAGPCIRARPWSLGGPATTWRRGSDQTPYLLPLPGLSPAPCHLLPSSACFLQSSFSLRPARSHGWQTKSLNKATGGRQLIKTFLFALRPGCHLRVALSSQTAKQNSRAAHAQIRPARVAVPWESETPSSLPHSPVECALETQQQAVLTWGGGARLQVGRAHPLHSSWGAGAQGPKPS